MDVRRSPGFILVGFPVLGFAAAAFATSGCVGFNLGTGSGGGDAGSSSGTASDGGAQGVDCIVEATTGATLCTGNSSCGSLAVDHDVYPDCGFRVVGQNVTLDIECACTGGMLCPVGVASSCSEASTMLQNQSESVVCAQVSEGRCSAGTGTASSGGAAQNNCNANCEAKCAGAPACIASCGC